MSAQIILPLKDSGFVAENFNAFVMANRFFLICAVFLISFSDTMRNYYFTKQNKNVNLQ